MDGPSSGDCRGLIVDRHARPSIAPACAPLLIRRGDWSKMSRTSSPLFLFLSLTMGVVLGVALDRGRPFVAAQAAKPAARPELSAPSTTTAVAGTDNPAKAS